MKFDWAALVDANKVVNDLEVALEVDDVTALSGVVADWSNSDCTAS